MISLKQETAALLGLSEDAPAVWTPPECLSFSDQLNSVVEWTADRVIFSAHGLSQRLPGVSPDQVQEVISKLMDAGFKAEIAPGALHDRDRPVLKALQDLGAVEPLDGSEEPNATDAVSKWKLTPLAIRSLQARVVLKEPVYAFHPPDGIPVGELGMAQLLGKLFVDNWSHSFKELVTPARYVFGGPKVWYTTKKGNASRLYLQCLLSGETVCADRGKKGIAHLQPVSYYKFLLGLTDKLEKSKPVQYSKEDGMMLVAQHSAKGKGRGCPKGKAKPKAKAKAKVKAKSKIRKSLAMKSSRKRKPVAPPPPLPLPPPPLPPPLPPPKSSSSSSSSLDLLDERSRSSSSSSSSSSSGGDRIPDNISAAAAWAGGPCHPLSEHWWGCSLRYQPARSGQFLIWIIPCWDSWGFARLVLFARLACWLRQFPECHLVRVRGSLSVLPTANA